MTTTPAVSNVTQATLRYLKLDPNQVEVRALVAVANRYHLDPLIGEIQLIQTRNGPRVYVSRDGMISIAHRSGQLDGIEVVEQRRNTANDGWTAYVSVWRKDMTHPFHYGAQCRDNEPQAKAGNGPEMALARAERRALKRAFAIPTDETFDPDDEPERSTALPDTAGLAHTPPTPAVGPSPGEPARSPDGDAVTTVLPAASTQRAAAASSEREPIKPPQLAKLKAKLRGMNASDGLVGAHLQSTYEVAALGDLSSVQAADLYGELSDETSKTHRHLRNSGPVAT